MSDPVLQIVTRTMFGLVCFLTLADLFRWRDLQHLEIAALFAGLALVIAEQAITAATGVAPPALVGVASVVALLAQPYLLLRVLAQFRDVPRHQQVIAFIGLLASSAVFVSFQSTTPSWAAMAIAAAFVYVEAYATVGFIRSAISQQGMTRRRLLAIAVGSGCLAAAIMVSGATAVAAPWTIIAQPLLDGFALGSALGYYVGMAPPRWLRKIWQGAEIQEFLSGLAGLSTEQRLTSTLRYIGPAAARATGGVAAIVARADRQSGQILHVEESETRIDATDSPPVSNVFTRGLPVAVGPGDIWGPGLRQLADKAHARGALVAPLRAGHHMYGVLVVFLARTSVFVRDDLAVLEVLADQAAMALDSAKLLEDSIRERTTQAAVMGSMHEGLLVMDQQEVIRYCNTRATDLLDLSEDNLLGRNAQAVLASLGPRLLNVDPILKRWRRAVSNPAAREALDIEFTSPRRSLLAEVFAVDGHQRGLGIVLRDVTAERDLVRMKDELISVVSHELRTPLASVVGFAELLRTRELNDAQRNQFLTVIVEEGRRLTALINDFLDLQRIESGRQDIAPRALELPVLLNQVLATNEPDPAHPIEVDLSQDLPPVRADADRIQQVITNLLSNARKYSPNGGPVRVSAREADGQV